MLSQITIHQNDHGIRYGVVCYGIALFDNIICVWKKGKNCIRYIQQHENKYILRVRRSHRSSIRARRCADTLVKAICQYKTLTQE